MRAALKAMYDTDLAFAFAEQGETATVAGQTNVPVVAGMGFVSESGDDIGMMPGQDMSLTIRTATLNAIPVVGTSLVTFRTKVYRITGVDTHHDQNAITLALRHVS